MEIKQIRKLVILGGGTAGFITAAALATRLKPEFFDITVLDSSYIDGIGVGESVLPSFRSLLRVLGLDEEDFIHKTGASIKLGIQFRGWLEKDDRFFHPLGDLGCELNGDRFFDCWLKARSGGDLTPLQAYAPSAVMASQQRFDFPSRFLPDSPLKGSDYALHVDAGLVCRYLRDFASQRQVKFIRAHAVHANLGETGCIESLELNNRETVDGDFFIDCSGLRGLLIDEAMNSTLEDWNHYLPCDRAVAVQTPASDVELPYSVNIAKQSGWMWRIPLQDRLSSGYVFSSDHCDDQQATRELLGLVDGTPVQDPYFIPFRNGMRPQLWRNNCIALGLAGGFLEPMESTAIHLAIRGVFHMLDLFPNLDEDSGKWPLLSAEYNKRMRADYEEIRDFIALHYYTCKRTDTEFWRHCQSMTAPDSLIAKVELFKARGELPASDGSLFKASSWLTVLAGMGVTPINWHPFTDMVDFGPIHQSMQTYKAGLNDAVQQLPRYKQFLSSVGAVSRG